MARIALLDLSPFVLGRALDPFPVAVRTLDALHLASMDYLRAGALSFWRATMTVSFVPRVRSTSHSSIELGVEYP